MASLLLLVLSFCILMSAQADQLGRYRIHSFLNQYQQEIEQNSDPQAIEGLNRQAIDLIKNYKFEPSQKRLSWISESQASMLFDRIVNHPVVGKARLPFYDPYGNYGFCFGRALYTHLELLRLGVQKEAIKKAMVVGAIQGDVVWQYHVITIAKGPGQSWWAFDTYFDELMTLEKWYSRMSSLSLNQQMRLYISDPNRIGPGEWSYNIQPGGLNSYNNYFQDLFRFFRVNPQHPSQKFQAQAP